MSNSQISWALPRKETLASGNPQTHFMKKIQTVVIL